MRKILFFAIFLYGVFSDIDENKGIIQTIHSMCQSIINKANKDDNYSSKMEAIASIPSLLSQFKGVDDDVVYAAISQNWGDFWELGIYFDDNEARFNYYVIVDKFNEIIKTYKETITIDDLKEWKNKLLEAYEHIIPKYSEIRYIFDTEIKSRKIAAIQAEAKNIINRINGDGDCSSKMEAIASIPSLLSQFKGIDESIVYEAISQNREDFWELGIYFEKNKLGFDYYVIGGKIYEIIETYKETITIENLKEWKDKLSKAYEYGLYVIVPVDKEIERQLLKAYKYILVPMDYVFNKKIKQKLLQKIKHMFDLKTPIDRIKYLKDFVYSVGPALNNAFLFDQKELVNFEFLKYEKGVYKINCDSRLLLCKDYYIAKERIKEILSRNFHFGQLYENIKEFISDEYISNLKSVVEELKKSKKTLGSDILVATLDTITRDLHKFYNKLLSIQSYILNKIHFNREFLIINSICTRLTSYQNSCYRVINNVCRILEFLKDPIMLKNKMFCTFNGYDDDDIIIPVLMSRGKQVFLEGLEITVGNIKSNFKNLGILYVDKSGQYKMDTCCVPQLLNKAIDNDIKQLDSVGKVETYLIQLNDYIRQLYRIVFKYCGASLDVIAYYNIDLCVDSIGGKILEHRRKLEAKEKKEKRTAIYKDAERNARKKEEKEYLKMISKESIMGTEKLFIPQMFADDDFVEEKRLKVEEEKLEKIEKERIKIQKELNCKIKESGDDKRLVIAEDEIKQLDVIKNRTMNVRQQSVVQQNTERKVPNRGNDVIESKKVHSKKFVAKTINKTNSSSNVLDKGNVIKDSKNNLRYIGMRSTNVDGKIILPEEYIKLPLSIQKEYTVYEE